MRVMLNGTNLTRFLLDRNLSMTLDARQNISFDRVGFTALGIDEFRPASGNTLRHATLNSKVYIYDSNDDFLISGNMLVTDYDRQSGTSQVEVLPDILAVLDATPTFFAQVNGITPADVIRQLFDAVGRVDLINTADVTRVSAILAARDVAAGLELNLVSDDDDRDKTPIRSVIDDFAKLFFVNCWIEKGILRMRVEDDIPNSLVKIKDGHVVGWTEARDEDDICNLYRIGVGDVEYTSLDIEPTLGAASRDVYGERAIELTEGEWIVSGVDGLPRGAWLDYAVEKARNKILRKSLPILYYTIDVLRNVVEEYQLGMRVEFQGTIGEIVQINMTEETASMRIDLF